MEDGHGPSTWPRSRIAPAEAPQTAVITRARRIPGSLSRPDGTVYQSSLSFNGGVLAAGSSSAILVSRSTDGGATWSNPTTVISDGPSFFNDKESITADPTDSRLVYALWDRLDNASRGPTYFSRTTDGGVSWEIARSIYDPGPNSQTLNNQVVVLPDGTLIDFFTRLDTPPTRRRRRPLRSFDRQTRA